MTDPENVMDADAEVKARANGRDEGAEFSETEETIDPGGDYPNGHDREAEPAAAWPEPIDLLGTLTPTPRLTRDMLPDIIADFAFDQAERIGVELAMVAMPCLAVCASALHDGIKIQPKSRDTGWTETARLWCAVVAESGSGKTPADNAAKKPLQIIERRWAREDWNKYQAAMEAHSKAVEEARANGLPVPKPPKLRKRRLVINDATMEKRAEILAENPRGVLEDYDELASMIGQLDAYRNGAHKDRTLMLQLWNGGPYRVDRVKGEIIVANWGSSICGGIQPERLRDLVRYGKLADDGMLQRLLLCPADDTGIGQDRDPDQRAKCHYYRTVGNLTDMSRRQVVRLANDARPYWAEIEQFAHKLKQDTNLPPALRNWLAKVPGNFARLLLTYHAVVCAAGAASLGDTVRLSQDGLAVTVSGDTARRSRDLMVYFLIPSAFRIYHSLFPKGDGDGEHARWIAGYILSYRLDKITDRDLYRNYRPLNDAKEDRPARLRAMAILADHSWVEPGDEGAEGVTEWSINPQVHKRFAQHAKAERQRRKAAKKRLEEAKVAKQAMWAA